MVSASVRVASEPSRYSTVAVDSLFVSVIVTWLTGIRDRRRPLHSPVTTMRSASLDPDLIIQVLPLFQ